MKLIYSILLRLTGIMTVLIGIWAVFFYITILNEINDEMDDALEDYSESIIIRALAGEQLPDKNSGTNNQYFLKKVDYEYVRKRDLITYKDSLVYISQKKETEPARILTTIFRDNDGSYHELTVAVPSIEKDDLQRSIFYWIIILYAMLLITIVTVSLWIFHRNMQPLYCLLRWLDNYRIGDLNAPLKNKTHITEFQKLNDAIIRNTKRNEELFEQQKQFIGNASHEMQTPLAISLNRLELLLEDEGVNEQQATELSKIYNTLERLSRMNKSLLLLTKIDNGQFPEQTKINWNNLLFSYIEDYKEIYAYRQISVEILQKAEFITLMNEHLADILLCNLLKNAFVHNREGGNIRIEINNDSFCIANTGIENPLNEKSIFERFYQGQKQEGSSGLGMAIVYAICQRYDLEINYTFQQAEHIFHIRRKNARKRK